MDASELTRRVDKLAIDLDDAHKALRAGYPDNRDWIDAEMAGLQYRLAVVRDSLSRRQAATV